MSISIRSSNYLNAYSSSNSMIDKNSKQYKALEEKGMISSIIENEQTMSPEQKLIYEMFGGRDATIKNMMRLFDSDGDMINQFGVGGMDVTGKPAGYGQKIIAVSEESRQEMFESVKRDFIQGKGLVNGDTTKRSDVFANYQKSVAKEDRLAGTWTLSQYEQQYHIAMSKAIKAVNPNWKNGQPFDTSILNGITRESIEATLKQNGNTFVRNSIDVSV